MDNIETLIKTKEKKARVATPTTTATATATWAESTSGNSCTTIPPMGRGRTLEETAIYLKIAAIQRKENDEKVVAIALAKRAAFVMRESIMRATLAKTNTKNPTTTKIKKVKVSTKSPPAYTIAFKVPPNNSCITLPSMRRIRTLQETLLHQKLAAIQQRKMNDDKVVAMALAKRVATSMDNIETLIKTKAKKARIDTDVTATATIVETVPSNSDITFKSSSKFVTKP